MLRRIMRHVDSNALQEDARKVGVNFITAGIVGVFIYHYVGNKSSVMLVMSYYWVTIVGLAIMFAGLYRRVKK